MTLASFLHEGFYERMFLTEGQIVVLTGKSPFMVTHLHDALKDYNWKWKKVPDGYSFYREV